MDFDPEKAGANPRTTTTVMTGVVVLDRTGTTMTNTVINGALVIAGRDITLRNVIINGTPFNRYPLWVKNDAQAHIFDTTVLCRHTAGKALYVSDSASIIASNSKFLGGQDAIFVSSRLAGGGPRLGMTRRFGLEFPIHNVFHRCVASGVIATPGAHCDAVQLYGCNATMFDQCVLLGYQTLVVPDQDDINWTLGSQHGLAHSTIMFTEKDFLGAQAAFSQCVIDGGFWAINAKSGKRETYPFRHGGHFEDCTFGYQGEPNPHVAAFKYGPVTIANGHNITWNNNTWSASGTVRYYDKPYSVMQVRAGQLVPAVIGPWPEVG